MFKTIFSKLLVTYLIIMIVTIAALSLVISKAYTRYVFSEKNKSLMSASYKVNELANDFNEKKITSDELTNAIDSMGYITDSKIYIVRLDKQTLADPNKVKLGEELEDNFLIGDLHKILEGQIVYREKQYSDKFDMYMVFTGVPWKTDTGIEGAILLFSPINHITEVIRKLNITIGVTSLIFILLSAVVIYIISLRISKPIKKMERAASKLAAGESTEDLTLESKDELGKLANTFNYMKEQLSNTEKMRSEFIANVSHDFRTPLTSINGFVEGMLEGVIEPKDYKKSFNIIHEETNRLTRLTSDILQLAKIQSNSIKLKKEYRKAKVVINAVIDSIHLLLEEKSISVSIECSSDLNVYADIDRLMQILINIVSNAVKYSEKYASISIQVGNKSSVTYFSIKDTGIGIPSDQLPFIFEKFYRVDKVRQSSQSGTGLGLNIVQSLIELHGGKIWVKSEYGKGTEIVFELPNV